MNSKPEPQLAPLLGTMAGVKYSFPRTRYGYPSIHYGDDKEWWGGNPAKQYNTPTRDSPIRDFVLTLNRSTFLPVSTREDRDSFARDFRVYNDTNLPAACERWPEFIFSPQLYLQFTGELKPLYETKIAALQTFTGPFVPRQDAFGLKQLAANREGGEVRREALAQGIVDVFDTWYVDASSWQTVIGCMHNSASVTPMKMSCVHYFIVPELKSVVSVRYMVMADVADWKLIEYKVRERVSSYVVKSQNP